MGSSGDSGHPHLHFEIRKSGYALSSPNSARSNLAIASCKNTYDPTQYISKDRQRGTIKQNYILGDVDGNGVVDVIDAMLVQRYCVQLIELDETQLLAADVDKNGIIDATDSLYILQAVVKLRTLE